MTANPPKNDTPDKALVEAARRLVDKFADPLPDHGDDGVWGDLWGDVNNLRAALTSNSPVVGEDAFQARVQPWLMECFGEMIAGDREERNHRFLEEALELVQSLGCSASEAHQLVDYVYGRPEGDPPQEVGGVMVTLAALCLANDLDMHAAGWVELNRVWGKVEQIRAKQAAKPKHSPLPQQPTPTDTADRYFITKGGAYYRPNAEGYTRDTAEAGRFTLEEAISHSHPNGPDGPRDGIRYEIAPTATDTADRRETIARVIDPDAWHETLPTDGCGVYWMGRRHKARAQADAILALIAQSAPDGWRPIETAPKDAPVLVAWTCRATGQQIVSIATLDSRGRWISDGDGLIDATDWMPLPAAPKPGEGA